MSYSMSSVFGPREMYHAIDAGEGRSSTTVPVWVQFLLGQNVAAALMMAKEQELEYNP